MAHVKVRNGKHQTKMEEERMERKKKSARQVRAQEHRHKIKWKHIPRRRKTGKQSAQSQESRCLGGFAALWRLLDVRTKREQEREKGVKREGEGEREAERRWRGIKEGEGKK